MNNNNKNNKTNNSQPIDKEVRNRIVEDALRIANAHQPATLNLRQQIMARGFEVNVRVQDRVKGVLHEVKRRGSYNSAEAQDFIYKLFREEFNTWSKEELCELTSMLYSGMAMGDVEEYMRT